MPMHRKMNHYKNFLVELFFHYKHFLSFDFTIFKSAKDLDFFPKFQDQTNIKKSFIYQIANRTEHQLL